MLSEISTALNRIVHIEQETAKSVEIRSREYNIREVVSKGKKYSISVSNVGLKTPRFLVLGPDFLKLRIRPSIKPIINP